MGYYVHSKVCDVLGNYYVQGGSLDVRGKVFSALADVRSNAFLDVKGCLKFFGAVFRGVFAWLKSMLSSLGFLIVVSPDAGHYLFSVIDGGFLLD